MGSTLTKEEVEEQQGGSGDAGNSNQANKQISISKKEQVKSAEKNLRSSSEDEHHVNTKSPKEVTDEEVDANETDEQEELVEQEVFNPDDYDPKNFGPILPNGEINWDCPCLGGAAHGPCATEFRAAFSCFHYSKDEPKGADCFPAFKDMHTCFSKYPELYKSPDEDENEDEEEDEVQFDEEELKVIEEESAKEEKEKKEAKIPEEPKKSEPEQKKEEKTKEKEKSKPVRKPFKETERLIPSGGQPAMI